MPRKKKPIAKYSAKGNLCLYLPKNISLELLDWLNDKAGEETSAKVIDVLEKYVNGRLIDINHANTQLIGIVSKTIEEGKISVANDNKPEPSTIPRESQNTPTVNSESNDPTKKESATTTTTKIPTPPTRTTSAKETDLHKGFKNRFSDTYSDLYSQSKEMQKTGKKLLSSNLKK